MAGDTKARTVVPIEVLAELVVVLASVVILVVALEVLGEEIVQVNVVDVDSVGSKVESKVLVVKVRGEFVALVVVLLFGVSVVVIARKYSLSLSI